MKAQLPNNTLHQNCTISHVTICHADKILSFYANSTTNTYIILNYLDFNINVT